MTEQNLWSSFVGTLSPPSPQIDSFLIKSNFPFLPTLASQVLIFKQRAPGSEFGDSGGDVLHLCVLLRSELAAHSLSTAHCSVSSPPQLPLGCETRITFFFGSHL